MRLLKCKRIQEFGRTKHKDKRICFFVTMFFMICVVFLKTDSCFAAGFKMGSAKVVKIGNKEFYSKYESYSYKGKICVKENGVEKVLVSEDSLNGFTTDGTILYYGKREYRSTGNGTDWDLLLYKVDVSSGTIEKVGSVQYGQSVDFCYKDQLYLDVALNGEFEIPNLCSYSISTGKFKVICDNTRSYFVKGDFIICYAGLAEFDATGHYMFKVCAYNYKKKKIKF